MAMAPDEVWTGRLHLPKRRKPEIRCGNNIGKTIAHIACYSFDKHHLFIGREGGKMVSLASMEPLLPESDRELKPNLSTLLRSWP
ncbi:hypothetical protein [Rhizobium tumorigenes]|uniref:Uncharacterized protein n=1 Tax=Rhizobium tumorigenes TaxID=2041385 RepID=A0AAF1K8M1_9HYPH|nr:hypothetical protein [Rhizobium tumorigenes]WFR96094.1 hypothetical protein PR017_02790 [Rhizobium tumorigenes]